MFQIRSAGIKGLGVFATKHIQRGTRIFSERPLFGIRYDQNPQDVYPEFKLLSRDDRDKVLKLSNIATKRLEIMRWMHALWYTAISGAPSMITGLKEHKTLLSIFRSNAFSLNNDSKFEQAIFPSIARLNHECIPNAQANFNDQSETMNVQALRDITPDEEITLSYLDDVGEVTTPERQERLESYGFECNCAICDSGTPAAKASKFRRSSMNAVLRELANIPNSSKKADRKSHQLLQLIRVIAIMRKEGLVGRELAARYFVAAKWCAELGKPERATEYAMKGLEIDEYALGLDHKTYWDDLAKVNEYRILVQPQTAE
jgi:hypothetical protein